MRLSIERLRTLVLAAGVLLLVGLAGFLAAARWRNMAGRRDLPQKLALDIQQEANGWTYSHERNGHTLYKIHAARLEQMRADTGGRVKLHDVKIELYGEDGSRLDRISGAEFEYDQKQGLAKASGPVEIVVTRPGAPLAIAPGASSGANLQKSAALASAAQAIEAGGVHLKTSALVFDQKSGKAWTQERVVFTMATGGGSAVGAEYQANLGQLTLERAVELKSRRGDDEIEVRASRAVFDRGEKSCRLLTAELATQGGRVSTAEARLQFRDDGSAERLNALNGVVIATQNGGRITAPSGALEFDQRNQPKKGMLSGGVTLEASSQGESQNTARHLHGSAPQATLSFTSQGGLQRARLERGVELRSEEQSRTQGRTARIWRSPVAEIDFRAVPGGRVEVASMHGWEGVQLVSEEAGGRQSRFAAQEATGRFGGGARLLSMSGSGDARLEQTTANGSRQRTSGSRLEVRFQPEAARRAGGEGDQIDSAVLDGNVVFVQEPQARAGVVAEPLRATAAHARYDKSGDQLSLTGAPRLQQGGMGLSAERIDLSQSTGEAWARGEVKASWNEARVAGSQTPGGPSFGGRGPVHAVASEAQLRHEAGANRDVITFRTHARLWQEANSIEAPEIVLDRAQATLRARSGAGGDPVRAVFLGAPLSESAQTGARAGASVIRVRGAAFDYSDQERRARMRAAAGAQVTAESAAGLSSSNEIELQLTPQGHTGAGASQVERMTARGRVSVVSQGRKGTGERLEYTGSTGEYVLTGTPEAPPRVTDAARGLVTGERVIFRSRDESVAVEGGAQKTRTETRSPR